ncbi:hypothetical protein [Polaromonas sp. YR568]|uniref:hypothetical protein n=1 Tax=Polaromonas sp. YR568 TaxID=1855301 RepID=UPI00398BC68F
MKFDDIVPILQRLQDPGPLDPNPADSKAEREFKELYIKDLHSSHGDLAKKLALEIQTSSGTRHGYLFSGTIGSGKSTELRRLAQELRSSGNYALVINAQDYLNPQMPISIVDLLLAMAMGVWEATAQELSIDPWQGDRWNWLKSGLTAAVDPTDVEVGGGVLKLKMSLRSNPNVRERLRKFHEARLDELISEINDFLSDAAQKIKTKRGLDDKAKMVLVVDSLEHFGGQAAAGQPDEVFLSLQRMFNTFASYLRLAGWSVVYSVPPLLNKLAPGIANAFGATTTYFLTSAHVFQDRSDAIDVDTVKQKLMPLVRKRIGETHVAELMQDAEIRNIIEMTGGDLRDLIRAVRAALLAGLGDKNTFPVTQAHLNQVYNDMRRPYLPLPVNTQARLAYVASNFTPELRDQSDWAHVISDLAQKRILLYLNGSEWYGVHPLLRDSVSPSPLSR